MSDPFLSIIIPTYNGSRTIEAMLESVTSAKANDRFEVLVCDDGSEEDMESIVNPWKRCLDLKYFRQKRFGERAAKARNLGIQNSLGKAILFVDDDCLLPPDLIDMHATLHKSFENDLVVVGSRQRVDNLTTARRLATKYELSATNDFRYLEAFGNYTNFPVWYSAFSCHLSVSRRVAMLGFDENFDGWGLEDQEFALRAFRSGAVFHFEQSPPVIHVDPKKPRDPFLTDDRGGIGDYSPFITNTAKFIAKHINDSEAVKLLAEDLVHLKVKGGYWVRSEGISDPCLILKQVWEKLNMPNQVVQELFEITTNHIHHVKN
jgi:glycosyltransferase involved in cell wall biosynthesis